jgi:hypothetical protein
MFKLEAFLYIEISLINRRIEFSNSTQTENQQINLDAKVLGKRIQMLTYISGNQACYCQHISAKGRVYLLKKETLSFRQTFII